jgi:hypothetical protein
METPPGYINDYFVGIGRSSASESDARNLALADALQRIVQSGTITLQGSQEIKTQSIEKFKDGQTVSFDAIDNVVNDIRVVGESKTIKGLREEEYYSEALNGVITVWSLVKIPKKYASPYSEPSKISPIWRSVVLPSWGQFYKGHNNKGYVIAISEAVLLPAGFILNNLKITNESDARNSRTQVLRDYYNEQANTYSNLSLGCFIAASAIYVYNVVDAVGTEGEKVYVDYPEIRMNTSTVAGATVASLFIQFQF